MQTPPHQLTTAQLTAQMRTRPHVHTHAHICTSLTPPHPAIIAFWHRSPGGPRAVPAATGQRGAPLLRHRGPPPGAGHAGGAAVRGVVRSEHRFRRPDVRAGVHAPADA